ncbi:MAG: hypothetical protein J2P36_11910 [Ktedonobacteraceae bacterium]|nr:hypothetical protein [Ktedonobacteraceae bacterium]
MEDAATLWAKDPNSESDSLTNAAELVKEAVFGRLEEPLIVAPSNGAHAEEILMWKMPCW